MKTLLNKISFNYKVAKRILEVSARKSKRIKMMYIEYVSSASGNSGITVKYRFSNALWYRLNNTKTTDTRFTVPKEIAANSEMNLTVQGLFRRSNYKLQLKEDYIDVIKLHD